MSIAQKSSFVQGSGRKVVTDKLALTGLAVVMSCAASSALATPVYYTKSFIDLAHSSSIVDQSDTRSSGGVSASVTGGSGLANSSVGFDASGNLVGKAIVDTYNNVFQQTSQTPEIERAKTKSTYSEGLSVVGGGSCGGTDPCYTSLGVTVAQDGIFSLRGGASTTLTYELDGVSSNYLFTFVLTTDSDYITKRARLFSYDKGTGLGTEDVVTINTECDAELNCSFNYSYNFQATTAYAFSEYLLISAETYGDWRPTYVDTSNTFHATLTPAAGTRLVGESGRTIGATSPENDVPEPASFALLGLGLVGLGFSRRRRS